SSAPRSLDQDELKNIALANVARRSGTAIDDLSIIHTSSPNTGLTKIKAVTFTIVDTVGVPIDVTLDGAGREVDRETLWQTRIRPTRKGTAT
ncbi:MAG: hypothetical protein WAV47_00805, partial [Blastocatellia bacterium]